MQQASCKSHREFLGNAVQFYSGYVAADNAIQYLPPMLVSAFRITVQSSKSRICRLLFKLAVEMDMMMNILAAGIEIPERQRRQLRGRCVQKVKKTTGSITLDKAVAYQNDED